MSEFPRAALEEIAEHFDGAARVFGVRLGADCTAKATACRQAIKAYDELSLRCVEDNTRHALEMAKKNAEIRDLKENLHGVPFPIEVDPDQLTIEPPDAKVSEP